MALDICAARRDGAKPAHEGRGGRGQTIEGRIDSPARKRAWSSTINRVTQL